MVDPRQFFEKDDAVNFIDLGKIHYVQINFSIKGRLQRILQAMLQARAGVRLEGTTDI
jgi:hypothetical protein